MTSKLQRFRHGRHSWLVAAGLIGFTLIGPRTASAAKHHASDLLSAGTTAYIEIHDLKQFRAVSPPAVTDAVLSQISRMPAELEACDIAMGFEAGWQRSTLLVQGPKDLPADTIVRAVEQALQIEQVPLIEQANAADNSNTLPEPKPVVIPEKHRNIPIVKSGKLVRCQVGTWHVWAADEASIKLVIDRALGLGGTPLAEDQEFVDARKKLQAQFTVAAGEQPESKPKADAKAASEAKLDALVFIRPRPIAASLRQAALLDLEQHPLLQRLTEEFVQPLVASPYLAFAMSAESGDTNWKLATPDEVGVAQAGVERLGSMLEQGPTFKPLLPQQTILSVSAYISKDAMAAMSRAFIRHDVVEKLAADDPDLPMILAGVPLITDIWTDARPEMQFVIARRDAAPGAGGIRLPAVAVIFRPEHPAKVKSSFIMTYLGSVRRQNQKAKRDGGPTLVMKSERRGEALLTGATYQAKEGEPLLLGPLKSNIEPSMAVVGNRFIIATSFDLASELVNLAITQGPDEPLEENLQVDFRPDAAMQLLMDNMAARPLQQIAASKASKVTGSSEITGDSGSTTDQQVEELPEPAAEASRTGPLQRFRERVRLRMEARRTTTI